MSWFTNNPPEYVVGGLGIGFLLCHLLYQKSLRKTQGNKERYNSPQYRLPPTTIANIYGNVGTVRSRVDEQITDVYENSSFLKDWSAEEKQKARKAAQDAISAQSHIFTGTTQPEQLALVYDEAHKAFQSNIIEIAAKKGDPVLQDDPMRLTRPIDRVALRLDAPLSVASLPEPVTA